MDSELDDFKNLRRLLALKRHEQPPPGYFDRFSREVSFRVQAGETVRETAAERLNAEAPWVQRFLEILLAKPQWSGAVGAMACALILGVVLFVERNDIRPTVTGDVSAATLALAVDQPSIVFTQPLIQPQVAALTNVSLQPNIPEGLFNAPDLKVTPVDQPGAVWLKH